MARPTTWLLAVTLALAAPAGLAACGGDGGGDDRGDGAGTTTTATTTAPEVDLPAAVDELCAASDEFQAALEEMAAGGPEATPSSEQQARLSEVAGEVAQLAMQLQGSVAAMLPGDAARFQECSQMLGGATLPSGS